MGSLSPSEIQYEQAHIHETRQAAGYGVPIAFFILATASVFLRVISRRLHPTKLALDDYLAIAGLIALIPFIAATIGGNVIVPFLLRQLANRGDLEVKNGVGRHMITLTTEEMVMQGKWELVNLFTYTTCITLIKLSILALLARIFGSCGLAFHVAIWVLTVWVMLWAIALYFTYGFQCRPFSDYWSLVHPCRSSLRLEYSASILNAVHDVLLFLLPQPYIWTLNLPLNKKLRVSCIFFIGFVATFMGILKISYVKGAPGTIHKSDATYSALPALIFNALEPLLAMVCSCLPSTPLLFRRIHLEGFSQITSLIRTRCSGVSPFSSRRVDSDRPDDCGPCWNHALNDEANGTTGTVWVKREVRVDEYRASAVNMNLEPWGGGKRVVEADIV
ncbi:hypothetical protein FE257_011242 [Aspergillus nanangensis]|uniref:Rhodopsin domain-containing protein n=1 Tax=Aspergillus nanangensis TaxID=2582783 RepID=A0AAD4GRJ0_ASPNN|nr:hypothetical protein FE257_011242 [Aspergillus nanangensis]